MFNQPSRGFVACAVILAMSSAADDRFEEAPILYSETGATNPISRLQADLDSGDITFEHDERFGYLKAVLDYLGIPVESQVLVFSKTSFQNPYISPATPRAIYYNDDVYIGTVQYGDVLEVSAADPKLGAVFYTLSQRKDERPEFVRQHNNCLQCHASTLTRGLPGHVVRSVYPDKEGFPILRAGTEVTTQNTPFEKRWGGWYVTGTHGALRHRGNEIAQSTERDAALDADAGANQTALPDRIRAERYLGTHSDIVSLMVLEHQARMHNLITQAHFSARQALHSQAISDAMFEREGDGLSESTQRIIANVGDKLIDYMLFVDETEFSEPIRGTSGFAETFAKQEPKDTQGRSLREFDLETRLFKYPLSFLIYSEQFDGLPAEMKDYIYRRLWNILTGAEPTDDWLHLTNAKCRAIRQILADTKSDLPAYWKH
jgi:hypothetical protein